MVWENTAGRDPPGSLSEQSQRTHESAGTKKPQEKNNGHAPKSNLNLAYGREGRGARQTWAVWGR